MLETKVFVLKIFHLIFYHNKLKPSSQRVCIIRFFDFRIIYIAKSLSILIFGSNWNFESIFSHIYFTDPVEKVIFQLENLEIISLMVFKRKNCVDTPWVKDILLSILHATARNQFSLLVMDSAWSIALIHFRIIVPPEIIILVRIVFTNLVF